MLLILSYLVFVIFSVEGNEGGDHSKAGEFQSEVDYFLGQRGDSFRIKPTSLLIFISLTYGYMLISSIDDIITSSVLIQIIF